MTNEKAIDLLDNLIGMVEDNQESDYDTALKMAIQALSQEPTDENLHREREQAYMQGYEDASKRFRPKSGKWVDYSDEGYVECPFCDHATNCEDDIDELHYCFYCGAKMESEEQE